MANDNGWTGEAFDRMAKHHAEERARRQAELNEKLGEPAAFDPDPDDARFGTGYWRAQGGVISYQKYANGYDPLTRREFTDAFIELLCGVKKLKVKGA